MYFLFPIYLWALLGLLVPIAIHLWSKKEGTIIKVGSVQLFQPSESSKSSSIRLNEWWLLLLRMLLITLIVGILSEPRLRQDRPTLLIAYVIEPSLLLDGTLGVMLDSLNKDTPVHIFETGFPLVEDVSVVEREQISTPLYWQLTQRLSEIEADSIVVFTKAHMAGIKGMRPQTPKNVQFITVPSEVKEGSALMAWKKDNEIELTSAHQIQNNTEFYTEIIDKTDSKVRLNESEDSLRLASEKGEISVPIQTFPSYEVQVFYETAFERDTKYVEAALQAIDAFDQIDISYTTHEVGDLQSVENDLTIWLSSEAVPPYEGTLLQLKENSARRELITPGAVQNLYVLNKRLNANNVIDEHFTEALFNLLVANKEVEKRLDANNFSVMDAQQLMPIKNEMKTVARESGDTTISHWFWLCLLPVLIGERLLSKHRKQ